MLFFKKLMSRYGIIFFVSYFAAFFVLVTLRQRYGTDTISTTSSGIPGDVFFEIRGNIIFFPLTTSLGVAALVTSMYEAYNIFKRY